ncbi:hypothetical protein Tco_1050350, partial [Tanacetum coccineum]
TWMTFGGDTRDLSSFGEETDEITDLHQDSPRSIVLRAWRRRRDENPIHTLGDYSKPSHEGYRNTIELHVGNNVVPLRSDTIRLVQNGCSFHEIRFEDLNQHLKDFLKLMDLLDLDGANRERTHNPFTIRERTGLNPQSQALGTTFEARVQDYMAVHTKRMERFENVIFKQQEEINDKMTEMFRLLKGRALEKIKGRKSDKYDVATGDGGKKTDGPNIKVLEKDAETKDGAKNRAKNKLIKKAEKEEVVEAPSSQPVEYYLKHRINEKLIEGLVDNNRFNDSLSGV